MPSQWQISVGGANNSDIIQTIVHNESQWILLKIMELQANQEKRREYIYEDKDEEEEDYKRLVYVVHRIEPKKEAKT